MTMTLMALDAAKFPDDYHNKNNVESAIPTEISTATESETINAAGMWSNDGKAERQIADPKSTQCHFHSWRQQQTQ